MVQTSKQTKNERDCRSKIKNNEKGKKVGGGGGGGGGGGRGGYKHRFYGDFGHFRFFSGEQVFWAPK